jgi:uncharacterized membrane protein
MWPAILVGSVGCFVLKFVGLSLPRRLLDEVRVKRSAELLPVALLTALIATQTVTIGRHLQFDARIAGLLAAVIAVRLRAPFLVVVTLACLVTALVRLAT